MRNSLIALATLVLAMPAAAADFTRLHSFSHVDGDRPYAGLLLGSGGALFGTTERGGASDNGTIFRFDNGGLTTLHSFDFSDGGGPRGRLIADGGGNLLGTAYFGGASNGGTIFRHGPGGLTTLHQLTAADGQRPFGGLVADGSGNLVFATSDDGFSASYGTVSRLNAGGGVSVLHRFGSSPDGSTAYGTPLLGADGAVYGTTYYGGGSSSNGTIYRVDGSGLTILHRFAETDPVNPFRNADGKNPFGTLIADGSGNLYGTTSQGGLHGLGTIFRLNAGGGLDTLHHFAGADGATPTSGLVADGLGNLFGVTSSGGHSNRGTIFRLNAGGLTMLHSFAGRDGMQPFGDLVLDGSGTLFGTTIFGGASISNGLGGHGAIFRFSNAATAGTFSGTPAVPEPASWAMLIAGFGLTGAALRRRRARTGRQAAWM